MVNSVSVTSSPTSTMSGWAEMAEMFSGMVDIVFSSWHTLWKTSKSRLKTSHSITFINFLDAAFFPFTNEMPFYPSLVHSGACATRK